MLKESHIDSSLLYFHGSNNGKIERFSPPSPEKPLFVTADIDYANAYLEAATVDGHSKFNEDEDKGKVYLLSLNADKIKMFDATKKSDIAMLKRYWPKYIMDSFEKKEYSVWSVFKWIVPILRKLYADHKGNHDAFIEDVYSSDLDDELGLDSLVDGIFDIDKKYGSELKKIFETEKKDWKALFAVVKIFNETLVKLGFNAFLNIEKSRRAKTDKAIGLFSVECVDTLTPKPLDEALVKKAIDALHSSKSEKKDYAASNNKIKFVLSKISKTDKNA